MSIIEILACLSLVGVLYLFIPVLLIERWRKGRRLSLGSEIRVESMSTEKGGGEENGVPTEPMISVLFAARNEELSVRNTIALLNRQDYPRMEIIGIDDRSEDETGRILEEESLRDERVQALHIETLPEGWLGKCHALWKGAELAEGEWLLFTDADVSFDPDVLQSAIQAAERYGADHLTLFPQLLWEDYLEASLLMIFSMMLGVGFRFWQVESKSMSAFVGIGAFNMIRRELYEQFEGHKALRLEIADDMKLGYLAKKYGGKSVAMYAEGRVRVRWREGAWDIVRGIIRSGFAGMDFRWWRVLYAIMGIITVFILPFFLPIFDRSAAVLGILAVAVVTLMLALGLTAYSHRIPLRAVFLYPIAALLFLVGITLSAVRTTIEGGVYWRETFYSIRELRQGSVR